MWCKSDPSLPLKGMLDIMHNGYHAKHAVIPNALAAQSCEKNPSFEKVFFVERPEIDA